jgi:hypothetical protein
MLASGRWFDLLDPQNSEFTIEDIAHGLGNICRYAGQCRQFYSVAEHSLHVSFTVESYELEALLHDAAEAFLGDITRPLKQLLPDYKRIEKNVEAAIYERFGLDPEAREIVKAADLRVLAAEQSQVMPPGTDDWAVLTRVIPAPIKISYLSPDESRQALPTEASASVEFHHLKFAQTGNYFWFELFRSCTRSGLGRYAGAGSAKSLPMTSGSAPLRYSRRLVRRRRYTSKLDTGAGDVRPPSRGVSVEDVARSNSSFSTRA